MAHTDPRGWGVGWVWRAGSGAFEWLWVIVRGLDKDMWPEGDSINN